MAKVLIAEDEESVRALVAFLFQKNGWTTYTAATVRETRELLTDNPEAFDAIILDRQLADGWSDAVVGDLAAAGALEHTCVIVVTKWDSREAAVMFLALGAWQFLDKGEITQPALVLLTAAGVALKRCRELQTTILGLPTLDDAIERVKGVVLEMARPDVFDLVLFADSYSDSPRRRGRAEDRPVLTMLRDGRLRYVCGAARTDVETLKPLGGDRTHAMIAVPIIRKPEPVAGDLGTPCAAVIGVIAIEFFDSERFSAKWVEVLRFCADLLGMFESVREARLHHDFVLMRELRHRLATSVHVMIEAVAAVREHGAAALPGHDPLAVLGRHVQIVNGVLEEAKAIADGPRVGELKATSTDDILDSVIDDGRTLGRRADVTFERTGTTGLTCQADPAALAYCLRCLVKNAVEAIDERRHQDPSPFAPTVRMHTVQTDAQIHIAVEDNGVGFGANIKDRLFNPLFSTKTTIANEGIGLYSVRRMIDKMGGRIDATSPGPLRGASFEVTLRAD